MNQNRFCGIGYFDGLGATNRLYIGPDQTETDDTVKVSTTKTDPSAYFTSGWFVSTIGLTGNSATAIAQGVRAEGKITSTFNLTSVDYGLRGITGIATHAGTGTVDRAVGAINVVQVTSSGVIDRAFASIDASGDVVGGLGEITYLVGHGIANQSIGTHNTLLLMGTLIPPTGNYAIYNSSTYPNYMYGATTFAGTVTINTLTSGRVPYASTSGLLVDSANMTFDGSRLSLAATGSSGGVRLGGDVDLYRSAADTLKTDDKFWCNSLQVGTSSTSGQALCASDSSGNVTFQTVVRKRSIVVTLCGAFTPAGTGGDTFEFTMPYSPADGTTSITWNMRRITLRVNVAGGAPAVTIEKSTATGAFSATTMGSVTMGSGNYEVSATGGFSSSTIASGDKLRFNATALGTATGWTVTVLFEEN